MARRTKADQLPSQLTFKYIFDDAYNPTFANGVYGGVTPSGELVLNFYLERHALPDRVTHEVTSEGRLGEELDRKPDDHEKSLVRFVGPGVVLTLDGARSVHQWLQKQIERAEQVQRIKTAQPRKKGELDA